MQLSTREAERVFRKLRVEAVESSHHVRGFVTYNGVRLLPVQYSNGRKDMPGHVPKRFAKSLNLSLSEFAELKRCTMSRDAYFDIQIERGLIAAEKQAQVDGEPRA
jgi:hypothetical protein